MRGRGALQGCYTILAHLNPYNREDKDEEEENAAVGGAGGGSVMTQGGVEGWKGSRPTHAKTLRTRGMAATSALTTSCGAPRAAGQR